MILRSSGEKDGKMANKVLVIGLDGATWNLIEPMVEQGRLPTIKKLMKEGVWGELQSTLPPVTGPAWVSFATGKSPGKHGVFDFLLPKQRLDRAQTITTEDIQSETFYEILCREGLNCILINLPGSFPPRIDGIVITSLLTKGDRCIFPSMLVEEIAELRDYRIHPNMSLIAEGKIAEYIRDIIDVEKRRFECAKRLFKEKEWDFFFVMFGGMDSCQHRIYHKLQPFVHSIGAICDEEIEAGMELFVVLDGFIKWCIENIPEKGNILIMSDHGARSFKGQFLVNVWLEGKGYLKTGINTQYEQPSIHRVANSLRIAQISQQAGERKIKVPAFLAKGFLYSSNKILNKSSAILYSLLARMLPIKITMPMILPNVGASTAIAISHSSRAIYINTKDRFVNGTVEAGNQYKEIRNRIISELKGLRSPTTGENALRYVLKKEDVYWGPFLHLAPDIVLVPDRYFINLGTHGGTLFDDKTILNDHELEGIFLAYGPHIKKGLKIDAAKIYDIAPTILHIFGLPIPMDIDGRVLKEIFEDGSDFARRDITYQGVESREEKYKIKSIIQQLKDTEKI